jgi:hypothetical protein
MAPPTQAGKFKPKKPAKPIKLGAAGAPIAVPSNPGAAVATAGNESSRQTSRPGRGGRGRGGGRGAGFQPQQQGQVFFTGNSKSDAIKRGSSASAGSKTSGLGSSRGGSGIRIGAGSAFTATGSKQGGTDLQEEVVGFMEEGVGSSGVDAAKAKERSSARKYDDSNNTTVANNNDPSSSTRQKSASAMDRYMYDSDSSDDEARPAQSKFLQPIQLPIPRAVEPPEIVTSSIGATDRIFPGVVASSSIVRISKPVLHKEAPLFAATHNAGALRKETDSFFLCQLPTRLVPFESAGDDDTTNVAEIAIDQEPEPVSRVFIPSVHEESFDNVLSKAEPGRLGKMLVYKSGKTVLELTGPSGQTVRKIESRFMH